MHPVDGLVQKELRRLLSPRVAQIVILKLLNRVHSILRKIRPLLRFEFGLSCRLVDQRAEPPGRRRFATPSRRRSFLV